MSGLNLILFIDYCNKNVFYFFNYPRNMEKYFCYYILKLISYLKLLLSSSLTICMQQESSHLCNYIKRLPFTQLPDINTKTYLGM